MIAECSDDVVIAAFTDGPKDKDFVKSLYLNHPEYFYDIMDRAKDHMIVDEALQSTNDEAPQFLLPRRQSKERGSQEA